MLIHYVTLCPWHWTFVLRRVSHS